MSEWDEVALSEQDNGDSQKKADMFAPAMSPSWSRSSRRSKKAAEKEHKPSTLKEKIKKIFD